MGSIRFHTVLTPAVVLRTANLARHTSSRSPGPALACGVLTGLLKEARRRAATTKTGSPI